MDSKEIQNRVNALAKAMLGKGLREPSAQFSYSSDERMSVYLRWKDVTKASAMIYISGNEFKFFYAEDPTVCLKEAEEFVTAMPSGDEARLKQFMGALANVIDLGKDNGIEVDFLNPLQATMKKLSDNILTDQRVEAAE